MNKKSSHQRNKIPPIKLWMIQNKKISQNRKNDVLVEILKLKKDIKNYIQDGYNLKSIWQYLSSTNQIKCCYDVFRKHVNNHIKNTSQNTLLNNNKKITECKNNQHE